MSWTCAGIPEESARSTDCGTRESIAERPSWLCQSETKIDSGAGSSMPDVVSLLSLSGSCADEGSHENRSPGTLLLETSARSLKERSLSSMLNEYSTGSGLLGSQPKVPDKLLSSFVCQYGLGVSCLECASSLLGIAIRGMFKEPSVKALEWIELGDGVPQLGQWFCWQSSLLGHCGNRCEFGVHKAKPAPGGKRNCSGWSTN